MVQGKSPDWISGERGLLKIFHVRLGRMAALLANPIASAALGTAIMSTAASIAAVEYSARRHNRQYNARQRAQLPIVAEGIAGALSAGKKAATAAALPGAVAGYAASSAMAEKKSAPAKKPVMAKPKKTTKKAKKKGSQKSSSRGPNNLVRPGPGITVKSARGAIVVSRGIIPVVNLVAGQCNRIFQLGINTARTKTTSYGCLFGNATNDAAYTGMYSALAPLYRKFKLNKLEIHFRSYVTSTSSGVIYSAFDDSPSTGLVAPSGIMNRAGACMQDYKRDCKLVWKPSDPSDLLAKYTASSVENTEVNLGYGSFLFFLANDQALGATVGNFEVRAELEFYDPVG